MASTNPLVHLRNRVGSKPRMIREKLDSAEVDFLDYAGTDPTGVADCRAALQRAVDDADDSTLYIPPGTYKIETTTETEIEVPGNRNLTIRGAGKDVTTLDVWGGILLTTYQRDPVLSTTAAVAVAQGDRTLTLDSTTGIEVGHLLTIASTQNMEETSQTVSRSHVGVVIEVDGSDVTLDRGSPIAMAVSGQTVTVRAYEVGRLHFRDMTILCGDTGVGYLLELQHVAGLRMTNVSIRTRQSIYQGMVSGTGNPDDNVTGCRVQNAVDTLIEGCDFGYLFYGVMPSLASDGTTVRDCVARGCRHITAPTGGAQGFLGSGLRTYHCYSGLDSHQNAYDVTYTDCETHGDEIPSKFRGRKDTLRNCRFYGQGIELSHDLGLVAALSDKRRLDKVAERCLIGGPITGESWGKTIRDCDVAGWIDTNRSTVGGSLVVEDTLLDMRLSPAGTSGITLHYHDATRLRNVRMWGPYYGVDKTGSVAGDVAANPIQGVYVVSSPTNSAGFVEIDGLRLDGFDYGIRFATGGDYSQFAFRSTHIQNTIVGVGHTSNNKSPAPLIDGIRYARYGVKDNATFRLIYTPVGSGRRTDSDNVRSSSFLPPSTTPAAPTSGTWVAGERLVKIAPVAGGTTGYVCTTGGTPGTWVEEGQTHLFGSATYDPASIADGAQVTTTVTVTGAALGDYAQASFSQSLAGLTVTAYVSATNTVTVVLRNGTGGAVDLASGTLRARVHKGQ